MKTWLICKCTWKTRKCQFLAVVIKTSVYHILILHLCADIWIRAEQHQFRYTVIQLLEQKERRRGAKYAKIWDGRNLEASDNWMHYMKYPMKDAFKNISPHFTLPCIWKTGIKRNFSIKCMHIHILVLTLVSYMCVVTSKLSFIFNL